MTLRDEELASIARNLAAKILDDVETKRLFKEALTEWLDRQYAEFGRWSFRALLVAVFGALIVFVMWSQGYHR